MPETPPAIETGVLPKELAPQALWLLFSDDAEPFRAERVAAIVRAAAQCEIDLTTLVGARLGTQLLAAAWLQLQPGRIALLWPPRLVAGASSELADRLLCCVDAILEAREVRLAQALLSPTDREGIQRLLAHGYRRAADLLYLVSHLEPQNSDGLASVSMEQVVRRALADLPGGSLEFEPFRSDQRSRLAALVERTYLHSLDIPMLDGLRRIDDVLEGYHRTGVFSPDRWLFVRAKGRDVGCLLLADHPQDDQWELVYMGLVPEVRGRGWGTILVHHAQRLALQAGRARLTLAVDAHNDPAVTIYSRLGFVEWLQRTVILKVPSSKLW